jgi:hypothetical protein
MSLINDALKKAARQRTEEEAQLTPAIQTSGGRKRIPRRGAPMTVQTIVLIVAAAAVLVIGSVVATFVLMSGKSESRLVQEAHTAPLPVTTAPAPAPAVVVNVPKAVAPPIVHEEAPPPPTPQPVVQAPPTPVAEAPRPAPKPVPILSRAQQIQNFIDTLRVTGVRTAGTDSKALVDGHVYRVDDYLDRDLGLKLLKVEPDQLTLVDSAGATYIKNF